MFIKRRRKKVRQSHNHYFFSFHNTLVEEASQWHKPLHKLYFSWWGKLARRLVRCQFISRWYGWYQSTSVSKKSIGRFITQYHLDVTEFEKPVEQFRSFNDFFTRTLKKEARPIDSDRHALISPVDGKLAVIPDLSSATSFLIKGTHFNLKHFLKDDSQADSFDGGTLFIFRLAPYDYHRFHFPLMARPAAPRPIDGTLESVNPMVYRAGVQPLVENKRTVLELSDNCVMVAVGAMFVGTIMTTYQPGKLYTKGDEAGYFDCGGSTVVILCKKGKVVPHNLFITRSAEGHETAVRMGMKVAHYEN